MGERGKDQVGGGGAIQRKQETAAKKADRWNIQEKGLEHSKDVPFMETSLTSCEFLKSADNCLDFYEHHYCLELSNFPGFSLTKKI